MREKMRRTSCAWVRFGKVGDEEVGEDVWEISREQGSVERGDQPSVDGGRLGREMRERLRGKGYDVIEVIIS